MISMCSHVTVIYGKPKSEKRNAVRQGIISNDCCIKLRIDAKDKSDSPAQDKAIAAAYEDKFIIPLDFEMLDSAIPYYQTVMKLRLTIMGELLIHHPTRSQTYP